jgi:hypothetical protein
VSWPLAGLDSVERGEDVQAAEGDVAALEVHERLGGGEEGALEAREAARRQSDVRRGGALRDDSEFHVGSE